MPRLAFRWASPGRLFAVGAAAFVAGMWLYVFAFHLGGDWQGDSPGTLDDPAFAGTAQEICTQARGDLAALPQAWETETPEERAVAVDRSVELFEGMLGSLARIPVSQAEDQESVDEWLDDWHTYVGDRAAYADRLRTEGDTRFYVTQSDRDDRQITLAIDRFAVQNEMPACETPSDLS